MINNIRKYQKIVLGIFTVCCIMFVGEFFIKSFLFSKPTEKKYVSMPNVVTINDKNILKFEKYADKINEWKNSIGLLYKRYGIDENSNLYISTANRSVINSFIEDTIFKKIAKELNIIVSSDEQYDILYGSNLDEKIKTSFVNENRVFDRNKYLEFLEKTKSDNMLNFYWLKEKRDIVERRINKKIKTLLECFTFKNSLQIKRKWEEENTTYDIKYVYKNADEYKKDDSIFNQKVKEYYEENKKNFKQANESFKIKYIIKEIEITDKIKNESINRIIPIIEQFRSSMNPEEFAKAKSDKIDNKRSRKYSKTVNYDNLPKCLKSKKLITVSSIGLKFPKTIDKPIKVYKITDVEDDKNGKKYKIVILYKNIFVDDTIKNNLYTAVENEISNINNIEEFEEFANENNTHIEDLDFNHTTSNIKNFDEINILKKNIYSSELKKEVNSFLPVIKTKNGYFIGYLYKYIPENSLKPFEDVKTNIEKRVDKKFNKKYNENIINNDKTLNNDINTYFNNKSFISGQLSNLKISDIDKTKENNINSIKDILKNITPLSNGETKFFFNNKKILKLNITKNKFSEFNNANKEVEKYIKNIRENKDKHIDYVNIFQDIYKIEKIDYAYYLI